MQGLADGEVAERPARFGHNEIRRRKPVSPFSLSVKQFANFFVKVPADARPVEAYGVHEPPVDVALNALSLAVATIPESLPSVLTIVKI